MFDARARVRVELVPGHGLGDDELRAMWRFRLEYAPLRAEVDPDDDFRRFVARCRESRTVMRCFDDAGRLGALLTVLFRDGRGAAGAYRCALPEYGFVHPALRGHPTVMVGWLRMLAPVLVPRPGRALFLAGSAYLPSYVNLSRYAPPVWSVHDAPAPARQVLDELIAALPPERWDAARGVARMPTQPVDPGPVWHSRHAAAPGYQRYLARCPDWREGYSLLVVCPAGPRLLARAGVGLMRRHRRRWGAGRR
ncbi:hypothetical protein [Haliangium sp.]|uniref:hypothetical protein n=1 Tax=Haliangium sp. TaxID=2663208 RepID=UPI003D0C16A5